MRILIINGPNLNLLGKRDAAHYGTLNLDEIEEKLKEEFPDITIEFFQSNIEGEIVNSIQSSENYFDAIIINPAGYSHTSVAIQDALETVIIPKIEVHLSHVIKRDEYRQIFITARSCDGFIAGFKDEGYSAAIYLIKKMLSE